MTRFMHRGEQSLGRQARSVDKRRARRSRRPFLLEALEERRLLAYTFSIVGNVATATSDGAGDQLFLQQFGGSVFHSVDNVVYISDWGGANLPAAPTSIINVITGNPANAHPVTLGGSLSNAGSIQAVVNIQGGGPLNTLAINDSLNGANTTYTINNTSITSTAGINVTLAPTVVGGGVTLTTGGGTNTIDVVSTRAGEPFAINGGAGADTANVRAVGGSGGGVTFDLGGGSNTLNVGDLSNTFNGIVGSVSVNGAGAATTLNLRDQGDAITRSVTISPNQVTGLGGAVVNYAPSALGGLNVFGGTGGNTYTVTGTSVSTALSTGAAVSPAFNTVNIGATTQPLSIVNQAQDAVTITPSGVLNLVNGAITLSGTASDLTIDGHNGGTSASISVTPTQVSGLAPTTVSFGPLHSLTLFGGTGGNAFTINGTPGATTVHTGVAVSPLANTVNVFATANPVTIDAQAVDTITLGLNGSLAGITAPVTLIGTPSNLVIDESSDSNDRALSLSLGGGGVATLTGLDSNINYTPSQLASFTFNAGTGTNTFDVLFNANGSPIPTGGGTGGVRLFYNGGGGPNTLNLSGTGVAINNEVYSATGPGAGSLVFDTIPGIGFTGLQPINDVVPVGSYLFIAPSGQQSVDFGNGPIFGGFQTNTISDGTGAAPPAFELANIANKGAVTLNVGVDGSLDQQVNLLATVPGAGLTSVAVATGAGNDIVNVSNTVAPTSVSTGSGNDEINVRVAGLAAGSTATLNGGPGGPGDTVDVDATGQTSVDASVAGAITFAPSTATINYSFVSTINIFGQTDQPIIGSAVAIGGIVGVELVNVPVATFTDADPFARAGDFVASIDWGDGSPTTPGIVLANGTGGFTVIGSHTYNSVLTALSVNVTITDTGSSGTTTVGGTVINISDSGGSVAAVASTANILLTGIAITPSAPITTAVEGQPLTNIAVATFTHTDPTATPAGFTALIDWGDGSPISAGQILQPGGPGTTFTIRGTHTYVEESASTLPITVTVIDWLGRRSSAVTTVSGVADAPLINPTAIAARGVEGLALGVVPVMRFTDSNPLGTISDFSVSIDWGDGTPATAGSVVLVGGSAAGATFEVLGNHTYAAAGTFTIIVTVTDVGGQTLAATLANNATIAAAPIVTQSTTVTGVEGIAIANALVATFTSANPAAVAGNFTVTIDWGDGTATDTVPAVAVGTANGVYFRVNGTHTYAEAGHHAIRTLIVATSGARGVAVSDAVIADAALTPSIPQPTVTATEDVSFSIVVGSFTDANPTGSGSDFRAVIDWGDGTPMSAGAISQPGGPGTAFLVSGGHVYADARVNGGSGSFRITIHVNDEDGASTVVVNTISVADVPIVLGGFLNPNSDSGESHTDGITNVTQPTFFGFSEPGSTITVLASLDGGAAVAIGKGVTDASGYWSITSYARLSDGSYTFTAGAVDADGFTTATTTVATITGVTTFVVDTVGPVVTEAIFGRLTGEIDVTFQDERSGIDIATISDSANYNLIKAHRTFPGTFVVTSLVSFAGTSPTDPVFVPVVINNGRALRGGRYVFTVRSGGARDVAGNALDGEFYGRFPSGNGQRGGDFSARLDGVHRRIFPAATVIGTASPQQPAGGGQIPVLRTATASRGAAVKSSSVAPRSAALSTRPSTVHDTALAQVTVPKRRGR